MNFISDGMVHIYLVALSRRIHFSLYLVSPNSVSSKPFASASLLKRDILRCTVFPNSWSSVLGDSFAISSLGYRFHFCRLAARTRMEFYLMVSGCRSFDISPVFTFGWFASSIIPRVFPSLHSFVCHTLHPVIRLNNKETFLLASKFSLLPFGHHQ